MFSLEKFYNILHDNLISQLTNGKSVYFHPFGTYQTALTISPTGVTSVVPVQVSSRFSPTVKPYVHCYFFDQEPLYQYTTSIVEESLCVPDHIHGPRRIDIFANTEHSEFKRNLVKSNKLYDWYYFYHGFAALDWYRDFQYVNPSSFDRFDKVFICYNHLISKLRSYRLHLVSNLIEQDLVKHGHVSLFLNDNIGTWQDAIEDAENPLDNRARVRIYQALEDRTEPLIIDTTEPSGSLSAEVNFKDLTSALFHVVTETVYFLPKLHLTEKVFKPIIAKRPFFLVSTPGSLAYLKSYGFKTFDQWIDESYDSEEDHYMRIEKITAELARLCALDRGALEKIHLEMQEVLEYNYNHFYNKFKDIIVDELVDNFEGVLRQINHGRQPNNHSRYHVRFDLPEGHLEEVRKRLKQ
jgi:hypothetical protein